MFKVGDKVRITGNRYGYHHHKIGDVGVIEELGGGDAFVKVGTLGQYVPLRFLQIDKREPKKETPPTNITSEYDSIVGSITVEDAKDTNILFMAHLYHGLGMSFRQVAKLTNVHERTVRRRFKKYGVPSRPMNGVKR